MKVKALCRNSDDYVRETTRDIQRVPSNYDPNLHPFEVPREYTRALNATKLERVFAKPFVASLDGHRDALSTIISGACDGEVGDDKTIKQWNMEAQGDGVREEPGQVFTGIDHHQREGTFVTCFSCVRYNPVEVIEFNFIQFQFTSADLFIICIALKQLYNDSNMSKPI
uniref:Ddb1 and cul4 associated factor 13 n=1 Tax=Sinocyclocheilus anshuiensis TaxID=1608454 RepID=A0A671MMA6_9TELE